mmetsp:Transcript_37706/g.43065  ORF Transcript_37706/g.43065 Transcript_37706/m.43065 type:complete len:150 (+) Transcript_37706:38-487(+)|eukprot:CAMPEP_0194131990 /NCGR_PEP_ID=MMETSP0152-20130528/2578_1 /TAXON_ID=1049557 /ORGANISM="Thalassiothrix antarctica, Strain L6-D1" /LENGTH=149 /DNA_ID=CAMNT_0038826893 /DNA_START=38 /DNA_END=487 /DNA_ORIENTATION=+
MIRISLFLLSFLASANSFVPNEAALTNRRPGMYLVVGQGKQLEAAWEASLERPDNDNYLVEDSMPEIITSASSAARDLVANSFALPASMSHPNFEEIVDGKDVYYPIAGSMTSCRIQSPNEEVYGWFSPVCRLSHPDSEDYPMSEYYLE